MKLLDLFTGTGSVAKVARDLGYEVTTLDIDARCNPDICADVLEFDYTIWEPGRSQGSLTSCGHRRRATTFRARAGVTSGDTSEGNL